MQKVFTCVLFITFLISSFCFSQKKQSSNNRTISPLCLCIGTCITSQPVSPAAVCMQNGVVTFSVSVSGTPPFQFQWRENSGNLVDNSIYSGTNTATLTITNPSLALNGKTYRCIITNCSGRQVITNNTATLTVTSLDSDINKDGITQVDDFNLLNTLYNNTCNNCPEDITHDGFVNNDDFLKLLGDYGKSCN